MDPHRCSLRAQTVYLVIFLLLADLATTTRNELTLERAYCTKSKPGNVLQSAYCNIRYISRKNLKMDIHWNLTRPVYSAWLHGSLFYKFNGLVYQKFPVDLWENICDWFSGKNKAYILDWTFGKLLQYKNFNHTCPLFGYYFVHVANISVDNFEFEPLIPSGRYLLDLQLTEDDRVAAIDASLYFSVSDHRLEVI